MSLNPHYEAVLADLEQMKADAEDGIRAIRRLMARSGSSAPAVLPSVAPPLSGSLTTRMVAFLGSQQGKSFRAEEIAMALGDSNVNMKTLRGTLARLAKDKKIGKHGRGRYRCARNTANASTEAMAA